MRLLLVGDLILDEPDPEGFFGPAASLLGAGDVVIEHLEVPHSALGGGDSEFLTVAPQTVGRIRPLP